MRTQDALNILGISAESSQTEIKKSYRSACKKYHPDINPAGKEMMQALNDAYKILQDYVIGSIDLNEEEFNPDYGEQFNEVLNIIIKFNVDIEICGAWIWVSGNTYAVKDTIKEAGFKFAGKKKMWYFRPEKYRSKNRKSWSMDQIRNKHGFRKVKKSEETRQVH
jgi:hypothetical protein